MYQNDLPKPPAFKFHTLKNLLNHEQFIEGKIWHRKRFEPNETVIVEGEINHEIFVVLSGKLMVCTDVKLSENKTMVSGLCELFEGEEFAHSCFFDHEPHCATVKAITSSELAVIDAEQLKQFLEHHTEIGYQILFHWVTVLLPRLRQSNKRIASLFSWGLKVHKIDGEIN